MKNKIVISISAIIASYTVASFAVQSQYSFSVSKDTKDNAEQIHMPKEFAANSLLECQLIKTGVGDAYPVVKTTHGKIGSITLNGQVITSSDQGKYDFASVPLKLKDGENKLSIIDITPKQGTFGPDHLSFSLASNGSATVSYSGTCTYYGSQADAKEAAAKEAAEKAKADEATLQRNINETKNKTTLEEIVRKIDQNGSELDLLKGSSNLVTSEMNEAKNAVTLDEAKKQASLATGNLNAAEDHYKNLKADLDSVQGLNLPVNDQAVENMNNQMSEWALEADDLINAARNNASAAQKVVTDWKEKSTQQVTSTDSASDKSTKSVDSKAPESPKLVAPQAIQPAQTTQPASKKVDMDLTKRPSISIS